MRGPARARLPTIHLATGLIMVPTAGLLVWANLQESRAAHDLGHDVPPELDPVTGYFFYRGWPLSPCWFCLTHGMRFRPDGSPLWLILVLDLVVAGLVLFAVAFLCNWIIEWLRSRGGESDVPPSRD